MKRVSDIAQLLDQASHLKSYDLARTLRTAPATLIGGFQSPIEKEFLELLLSQPAHQPGRAAPLSPSVIICPARGLANMRIPRPWRDPLAAAKPVYTLPSPHNTHLITLGAQPISPPDPVALLAN